MALQSITSWEEHEGGSSRISYQEDAVWRSKCLDWRLFIAVVFGTGTGEAWVNETRFPIIDRGRTITKSVLV